MHGAFLIGGNFIPGALLCVLSLSDLSQKVKWNVIRTTAIRIIDYLYGSPGFLIVLR